jgi:DNA-binding SARP family transcriptional activator
VIGALWPESEPEQGSYNLRRALSDLRSALGPAQSILTTPSFHTLRLEADENVSIDLSRFDELCRRKDGASLRAAVAIYRGPLLEGWNEEWLQTPRSAYEQECIRAIARLVDAAKERSDWNDAEYWLRQHIAIDPFDERAYRELMDTLRRAGSYSTANLVYRELRLFLRNEINTEPAAETTALYKTIQEEARIGPSEEEPWQQGKRNREPDPDELIEEGDVAILLPSLLEKNLVFRDGEGRWRCLESIRGYGRLQLEESGEGARIQEKHASAFAAMSEAAETESKGAAEAAWLKTLDAEHENLRSALEFALRKEDPPRNSQTDPPSAILAQRICGNVWRYWQARGLLNEGRKWCDAAIQRSNPVDRTALKANVINGAGCLALIQGDLSSAKTLYEESLAMRQELGDEFAATNTRNNLGIVAFRQGDYARSRDLHLQNLSERRARGDRTGVAGSLNNLGLLEADQGDLSAAHKYLEESLAISRELGDREGVANSLINLGCMALFQGHSAAALPYLEESIAIARERGDPQVLSVPLYLLGCAAIDVGDLDAARRYHVESIEISREVGDRLGMAGSLEGFADLAAASGDAIRAAKLWGASAAMRLELGVPQSGVEYTRYEAKIAAARSNVDPAIWDEIWRAGSVMTAEQAVDLALDSKENE